MANIRTPEEFDYSALPMNIKITNAIVEDSTGYPKDDAFKADDAGNRGVKEIIAYDELEENEKFDFVLDCNGDFVTNREGKIQVVVTRKYRNTARVIQFYRRNLFKVLMPGDTLTVAAQTSEEAAYYFSLASNVFTVEKVGS